MVELTLKLFGTPTIHLNGNVVVIRRRKEAALLYYLACAGAPVAREQLFELLADADESDAAARRYFNVTIHRLAQLLPECLSVERDALGFAPTCSVWVDVGQFRTAVVAFQAGQDPAPLQAAIDLYQGELLNGFSVRGATMFEDWLMLERENLHRLLVQALTLLIVAYESRQDTTRGIAAAQRLLALEPWHETTHRQLMLLLARDGQYRAALAQYETCCRILAEELGAEPLPETVALYERLRTIETPPPHNLLPTSTPFIGRETELTQVQQTLSDPRCRLLTLLGLGGVGKTRLALEAARHFVAADTQRIEQTFPDGVYQVSLVGIESTTLSGRAAVHETINRVAIAIGQALDLTFTGKLSPPVQLQAALKERRLLLLLDNYEHLLDTVDLLLDLLHHAPALTLLVTSRERLHLEEEWLLTVGGLPLPTTPAEVPTVAASRLFIEEARRMQLTWSYTAADAWPIARLCRLVDGLPLALKLAAATLRYTTCAALVVELTTTFDSLTTTLRNIPERHRSVRAVIAYSWHLLTIDEQTLLRRIAVFHGRFDEAAVRSITQIGPRQLAGLVDKLLVSLEEAGHYVLHELVRKFAADQPAVAADEVAQTMTRHAYYYARFVEQHHPNLLSELDNIRAAWRWTVTNHDWETATQMQPYLAAFYERTGLLQEGEAAFAQAVANLTDIRVAQLVFHISYARFLGLRGQSARALEILASLEPLLTGSSPTTLIASYHEQRGWLLANQSMYADAIDHIEQAHTRYEQTNDAQGIARSAYYLGIIARRQGDYKQAVIHLETVRHVLTHADTTHKDTHYVLTDMYIELGVVHSHQGRPEIARTAYLEALRFSQTQHDRFREAVALNNLGTLAQEQRDLQRARDYFQQALTLRWQMGDRAGEASTRFNLAGIDHDLGHYSQARDGMQATLTIFEEIDNPWEAVNVWNALGILYQELGELVQAERSLQQGLSLSRSINDEAGQTFLLANLGLVLMAQGMLTVAVDTLQTGLQLAQQQGDADLIATFQSYLGLILVEAGQPVTASTYVQQSLHMREQLAQYPLLVDDWSTLALAALAQGDNTEAQTLAVRIHEALIDYNYVGPEFPQRACFVCYQIFQAVGDTTLATSALNAAVQLVEQRAAQITETDLRQSYCEQVPVNRQILTAAGRIASPSETDAS